MIRKIYNDDEKTPAKIPRNREISKKRSTKLRLTGGRLKGKSLFSHQEKTLRPTTSMVRESIFNILLHGRFLHDDAFITPHTLTEHHTLLQEARVADLFCGTGILGFEALSRGSNHCVFIEQNKHTLDLARDNASHLNLQEQSQFIRSDSTALPPAAEPVDLVFMDPPYGLNLAEKSIQSLERQGWLTAGSMILLEQGKRDPVPNNPAFILLDDRVYDKIRITLLQYRGA